MSLKTGQQFLETISRAHNTLITFRKEWQVDAVATALALQRVLQARGKQADIVADNFLPSKNLKFLPGIENIRPSFRKLQKFIINLDVKRAGIDELSYDMVGDSLKIFVTPKDGQFESQDVTLGSSDFKYDLVICIDTPDYPALGPLFQSHTDFFFHRPVINIDHDPANERFGNLNMVDIAASSAAEVLHDLLVEAGALHLDEDIATCLLTGMISKTRSFKTARVTPKTLKTASELIAGGGKRDDIVRNLYRIRNLPTLKLWGRTLSRLKYDPVTKMAWSLLVRQDFIHAGADETVLPDVMEELLANSPEAEICGVLYEKSGAETQDSGKPGDICALVSSERHGNAVALVSGLKPEGDRRLARICFPGGNLIDAERALINTIYQSLGKVAPYADFPTEEPMPAPPELGHPELVKIKSAKQKQEPVKPKEPSKQPAQQQKPPQNKAEEPAAPRS